MSNISDRIEQFILSNIGDDIMMDLSRNELASYFAVAPSQINYVLSTRFTLERGYVVEGKRGGGGYIRLIRVVESDGLKQLYDLVGDEIGDRQAVHLLARLNESGKLSEREYSILCSAISNKALSSPMIRKDEVRAGILKSVFERLFASGGNYDL